MEKLPPHPMQPIILEHGEPRFRPNKIVRALLDTGKLNMNDIANLPFDDEDRVQFLQLIGYSVDGFGEVSYVPCEVTAEADEKAEQLLKTTMTNTG